jgi:drug/metabolite transporter (DMT)-like permease
MQERSGAGTLGATLFALPRSPYVLLAFSSACWAGNILVGRAVHLQMSAITLAFWRWSIAALIILVMTLPAIVAWRRELLRQWRYLALMGLLGVALFHWMYYIALHHTQALNAAIISSVTPAAIVLTSWLMTRETITWRQSAGVLISILGVLIIITKGDPRALLHLRLNVGDLWALATVPCWGFYTVLLRRHRSVAPPMAELAVMITVGALLLTPFYAWELATVGLFQVNPATLGTVVYISLFGSVLAYLSWNSGVAQVGPNKAGLFLHLIPVFTTVLAIAFLGERLYVHHGLGALLIIGGIYLVTANTLRVALAERDA